jgi:hypothetical protein
MGRRPDLHPWDFGRPAKMALSAGESRLAARLAALRPGTTVTRNKRVPMGTQRKQAVDLVINYPWGGGTATAWCEVDGQRHFAVSDLESAYGRIRDINKHLTARSRGIPLLRIAGNLTEDDLRTCGGAITRFLDNAARGYIARAFVVPWSGAGARSFYAELEAQECAWNTLMAFRESPAAGLLKNKAKDGRILQKAWGTSHADYAVKCLIAGDYAAAQEAVAQLAAFNAQRDRVKKGDHGPLRELVWGTYSPEEGAPGAVVAHVDSWLEGATTAAALRYVAGITAWAPAPLFPPGR